MISLHALSPMADYNLTETGKGPCKEGQPITVMDQTKNKTQTNKQNKQKQQRHPVITSKKTHNRVFRYRASIHV